MAPDETPRDRADARLEQAIADGRIRDPRPFYRSRLRWLKEHAPADFERARTYYEETLIPRIARDDDDPVACWLEYGGVLAELGGPGRTLEVDGTGRARPHRPPPGPDRMVLHIPDAGRQPALAVSYPVEPSRAQRAAFRLLVEKKLR